mmetsp:Transcript_91545/g.248315  ORF Transcript_91545/g.248315 Transcript_91545/m.248315 type:complete len:110 (-) Transcript_91545:1220-1549(-)
MTHEMTASNTSKMMPVSKAFLHNDITALASSQVKEAEHSTKYSRTGAGNMGELVPSGRFVHVSWTLAADGMQGLRIGSIVVLLASGGLSGLGGAIPTKPRNRFSMYLEM